MARRGRKSNHTVKLGWREIRKALTWLLWKSWCYISMVKYVFLPFARIFHSVWTRRTYSLDQEGSATYRPSICERLATAFRSDVSNKRRLLDWAQAHLPAGCRVTNYSTSWCDGVAFCALLESLRPGACPRYDLLKASHKVNNCRLGLKLAQKHFGIPQTIITPEEMSLTTSENEVKMKQLLSLVKWASLQRQDQKNDLICESYRTSEKEPSPRSTMQCTTKGSGLLVGLVSKRCKFDVYAPISEALDMLIEIRGPNNQYCSERINSLFPKSIRRTGDCDEALFPIDTQLNEKWKMGKAKTLDQDFGHYNCANAEDSEEKKRIPFQYQCVGEGHIQVSYVPRSSGLHQVIIFWQGKHIKGSPFNVIVAETLEKLSEECKGCVSHKKVTFDTAEIIVNKAKSSKDSNSNSEVTDDESGDCNDLTWGPKPASGVAAAVLSRSSKVQRSISRSGVVPQSPKQGTVTRRRVLKRIITTGGYEIVIHETSDTPFSSRQSSRDNDSTYPTESTGSKERKRSITNTSTTKSFDCEISYDSDTSNASRSASPPIEYLLRRVAVESIIYGIIEQLIDNVLKHVRLNAVKESSKKTLRKKTSYEQKSHSRLSARISLPITNASSKLLLPPFDVRYQCSPFTSRKEIKEENENKQQPVISISKIANGIGLVDSTKSSNEESNGHKKLTPIRSFPLNLNKKDESRHRACDNWISSWLDAHCPLANSISLEPPFSSPTHNNAGSRQPPRDPLQYLQEGGIDSGQVHVLGKLPYCDDVTGKDSARVTVRTQLKGKGPRTKDISYLTDQELIGLNKQVMELNPTFGKSCIMDIDASMCEKLSNRSMTLPSQSGVYEDTGSTCKSLDMHSFQADELDTMTNGEYGCHSKANATICDAEHGKYWSRQGLSNHQLRLSASLPTLSRNWTAFEIDPDDDSMSLEEMAALSMSAQLKKKRATLAESELSAAIAENFNAFDAKGPKQIYSAIKPLKAKLSVEHASPVSLSPNVSPFSSPGASRISSRRGSLARADISSLQKVNEETFIDFAYGNILSNAPSVKDLHFENAVDLLPLMSHSSKISGMKNSVISDFQVTQNKAFSTPYNKAVSGYNMNIRIPKATIDRWTQVNYDEIKQETGWVRPTTYVKPRARIIRCEAVENDTYQEYVEVLQPSNQSAVSIPTIVCQKEIVFMEHGIARSSTYIKDNQDSQTSDDIKHLLHPNAEKIQPVRQSTIDTVDSGIADDQSSPKQNFSPVPTTPPPVIKPKFISGHRAVTRSRYRGKISLDPRLTTGHSIHSTATTFNEDERVAHQSSRRKAGLSSIRSSRTNTDRRKSKRRLPSREDSYSVSENEARGLRSRQTYRIGCCKKRVTFSRRVLMYRRSSSRTSSKNSRSREDTIRSLLHPETCLPEVTENPLGDQMIHKGQRTSVKKTKPIFRKKNNYQSSWLSQISRESRELQESWSFWSKKSVKEDRMVNEDINAIIQKTKIPAVDRIYAEKKECQASTCSDLIKDFTNSTEMSASKTIKLQNYDESNSISKVESINCFDGSRVTAKRRMGLLEDDIFNGLPKNRETLNYQDKYREHDELRPELGVLYQQHDLNPANFCTQGTPDFPLSAHAKCVNVLDIEKNQSAIHSPILEDKAMEISCNPITGDHGHREDSVDNLMLHTGEGTVGQTQFIWDQFERELEFEETDNPSFGSSVDITAPDPFKCQAYGCGLKFGQVGSKNNFQVHAYTRGNGALSVSITGPRPRTVIETTVTYTADDIFEVIFEVTQPGIYLINIKWSEYCIPGSPFICQVAY